MYSALSSEAETQHVMALGMALSKVVFFFNESILLCSCICTFYMGKLFHS